MPCDRQAAHSINLFQDAGQATKGQHGLLLTVCLAFALARYKNNHYKVPQLRRTRLRDHFLALGTCFLAAQPRVPTTSLLVV